MRHHRVVDEHDAQAFAVGEPQRLGVRELHAVERPREALHVAGQVQLDGPTGLAAVGIVERAPAGPRTSARAGRCRAGRCPGRRAATSAPSSACRPADCRSRWPDAAALPPPGDMSDRHADRRLRRGQCGRHADPAWMAAVGRRADRACAIAVIRRADRPRASRLLRLVGHRAHVVSHAAVAHVGHRQHRPRIERRARQRAGPRARPACPPRSRCDRSTARRS